MCAALLLGLGLGSSQFFSISVAADADAGAGGRPWCQPQLMPSYSFFSLSLPCFSLGSQALFSFHIPVLGLLVHGQWEIEMAIGIDTSR